MICLVGGVTKLRKIVTTWRLVGRSVGQVMLLMDGQDLIKSAAMCCIAVGNIPISASILDMLDNSLIQSIATIDQQQAVNFTHFVFHSTD